MLFPCVCRAGLGWLAGLVLATGVWAAPQAVSGPQRIDAVEVELVAEQMQAHPGGRLELAVRLKHDPHWHTYWRNPGDSGLATQIEPVGPSGSRFGPVRWPAPQRIWVGPLANYGYEGEILLPFSVDLPPAPSGSSAAFSAKVQWLVCREVCIPGEAEVGLSLPWAASAAAPQASRFAPLFTAQQAITPDPSQRPLQATLHASPQRLSLAWTDAGLTSSLRQAEFFPYAEAVIKAPAPQVLLRTATGWRLDLQAAEGTQSPEVLEGVLRADGRVLALHAQRVSQAAPEGTPVSVAERPPEPPSTGSGGGLLDRLSPLAAGASPDPGGSGEGGTGLLLALLLGAVGGLLLNLMPCVFPVIGLKILGFAQAATVSTASRQALRRGALAFGGGVLVSFWLLAGAMLLLRAAGESIGWGFQLQSPSFVAAMLLLFVGVGLNFAGTFDWGFALTRLGGAGGDGLLGSFGSGVLAVLVATPCTAPFMGSALGFTLTQPAPHALAVFSAIGFGMALPYLVLAWIPAWIRFLPRPGRWMETLKQALAFPMFATAAWLAWVLVQQAGPDALLKVLLAATALALGAWGWGRWMNRTPQRPVLALALACVAVAACASVVWPGALPVLGPAPVAAEAPSAAVEASRTVQWLPWSPERVREGQAAGRPVFVDFTAAWCVSCQVNKALVLDRTSVQTALKAANVLALRADWTHRDPAITEALSRLGRNGVPVYLVYRPGESAPRLLPEVLTPGLVLEALGVSAPSPSGR